MSKFLKDALKIVESRDPFLPGFEYQDEDDMDRESDEDRIVDVGDEEDMNGSDDLSDLDLDRSDDFEEQEEGVVSLDGFLNKWGTNTPTLLVSKLIKQASSADPALVGHVRELLADLQAALENYHATK